MAWAEEGKIIPHIGVKACTEYILRQYNSMSEEEKQADEDAWLRWQKYCDARRDAMEKVVEGK